MSDTLSKENNGYRRWKKEDETTKFHCILMTCPSRLCDNLLHLVDLPLAAAHSSELCYRFCQFLVMPRTSQAIWLHLHKGKTIREREEKQKNTAKISSHPIHKTVNRMHRGISPQIEGRDMRTQTYPLLRQLSRPLVLRVPQQLDNTALIRSKAGNLLDDLTNECSAAGDVTLSTADSWLGIDGSGFLCRNTIIMSVLFISV
jgi:hypothetical protein